MRTFHILVSKHFTIKTKLGEVLQKSTSMNLDVLADAAAKGAVWLQKGGKGKILRIRSLDLQVSPEDKLVMYYDSRILIFPELTDAKCLLETSHYGIWLKPAGVLPQGTQVSDHTSLLRYVEKFKQKEAYLIHRLDRETEGLMIIGYTAEGAAKLSDLFQNNKVYKTYQAIVKGEIEIGHKQTVNEPLDGKVAITHFEALANGNGCSLLLVKIETGRLHQIRRHLEFIGNPIMGDPKYGRGNKNKDGLKLLAKSLSFLDPWTKKSVEIAVTMDLSL
jgi:tRNA pseudouridine32 synthase/23S rRNA pseudouridine746 synthase